MIHHTAATFILFVATTISADLAPQTIQHTIDQTVWKKFQQAFNQMDGEALNALYADNVLRVTPQGIDTKNSFKQYNLNRFKENKADEDRIALDFWFDSRNTNATTSYEVGFYRMRLTTQTDETSDFYGQFHIVLHKVNNQWKIAQDWDTGSIAGRKITAEIFNRNSPEKF